jgi:N-acetylglucosaminyldiphosphoundecaprenol N-acetyl-beta-D-mannosaminyltransferase
MVEMGNKIRHQLPVLDTPIDAVDSDIAVQKIIQWAHHRESRAVYFCNVHSLVTARIDSTFAQVLCNADLALPDGAPVAWVQRLRGAHSQKRISGPDLMWDYFRSVVGSEQSIYLYGAREDTLDALKANLCLAFPKLKIAGSYSPPFRSLTESEEAAIVSEINSSGAGTVWVSLGCPKQEKWIHAHRDKINAVMLGVGAAFDFHAGTCRRAPTWMRENGFEWLYRLIQEPSRLWRRYLLTNSLFIIYASREIIQHSWCRVRNSKS